MARIYTLIVVLFLFSSQVRSQAGIAELKGINEWCWVPRFVYSYQGASFLEPGLGYIYVQAFEALPLLSAGPYASVDLRPGGRQFVYGPKIGIEGTYIFLTGKLNSAFYTNGSQSDLRITPEIGATLFGWITCCYGYNFKLQRTSQDLVSQHKVTVGLNLMRTW